MVSYTRRQFHFATSLSELERRILRGWREEGNEKIKTNKMKEQTEKRKKKERLLVD
jgi:hypothetical protein